MKFFFKFEGISHGSFELVKQSAHIKLRIDDNIFNNCGHFANEWRYFMNKKTKGIILATIVGALFTNISFAKESSSSGGRVKCIGGNSCKGKSACQTASNGCKGQNSCRN